MCSVQGSGERPSKSIRRHKSIQLGLPLVRLKGNGLVKVVRSGCGGSSLLDFLQALLSGRLLRCIPFLGKLFESLEPTLLDLQ